MGCPVNEIIYSTREKNLPGVFLGGIHMDYIRQLMSIEEKKVSVLIVSFVMGFVFCLIMYYLTGDISGNLLNLVQTLVFGIVGINVADKFKAIKGEMSEYNQIPFSQTPSQVPPQVPFQDPQVPSQGFGNKDSRE